MTNDRPWTKDEARVVWVRLYRKGREKGGWVYLDEELLRESGMDPEKPLMVKRYALRPEARHANLNPTGARGRIILNVSFVTETGGEDGFLTRRRRPD